jgi:hypothetical protein
MKLRLLLTAAVLMGGAPMAVAAHAQMAMDAPPACAAIDKAIPAPWSGWTSPEPLQGGKSLDAAGRLSVGHTYSAGLSASSDTAYMVPLPKPAAAGTFAGLFTLSIGTAGTYSIALGNGAWIDVAPVGGPALTSVAHGHGPACTTIHKVVDFALQPGTYVVQISGAQSSPVVIGIAPKS